MLTDKDEMVQAHYQSVAQKYGASSQSTMEDEVVREKEIHQILKLISALERLANNTPLKVLDLGCGNGYTLSTLSQAHPANHYYGIDFSEALLAIARTRQMSRCEFRHGDARELPFEDNFFDAVYTERCLINILDWEQQRQALKEIARVLKPTGSYLMIESFTDGLANNNRARQECGLEELEAAYHNKYFDKDGCFKEIADWFTVMTPDKTNGQLALDIPEPNFLSSHYFIARVLHPLVSRGTAVKNTEFVKFFSFLPPVGNYSPIQAFVLRKKSFDV